MRLRLRGAKPQTFSGALPLLLEAADYPSSRLPLLSPGKFLVSGYALDL